MNDTPAPPDDRPSNFATLCRVCGRTAVPTVGELRGYVWRGWPECCGERVQLIRRPRDAGDR